MDRTGLLGDLSLRGIQTGCPTAHRISWHSPSEGILKLNFEGSFVHQIFMGGFGGVICDWAGRVLKNLQDL